MGKIVNSSTLSGYFTDLRKMVSKTLDINVREYYQFRLLNSLHLSFISQFNLNRSQSFHTNINVYKPHSTWRHISWSTVFFQSAAAHAKQKEKNTTFLFWRGFCHMNSLVCISRKLNMHVVSCCGGYC